MEGKYDGKRVKNGGEREKVMEGRMMNMVEKVIEREWGEEWRMEIRMCERMCE